MTVTMSRIFNFSKEKRKTKLYLSSKNDMWAIEKLPSQSSWLSDKVDLAHVSRLTVGSEATYMKHEINFVYLFFLKCFQI